MYQMSVTPTCFGEQPLLQEPWMPTTLSRELRYNLHADWQFARGREVWRRRCYWTLDSIVYMARLWLAHGPVTASDRLTSDMSLLMLWQLLISLTCFRSIQAASLHFLAAHGSRCLTLTLKLAPQLWIF